MTDVFKADSEGGNGNNVLSFTSCDVVDMIHADKNQAVC